MAVTAPITSVKFTDPSLQNFHTQRKTAYEQTKKQIAENFSTYQNKVEALDSFAKEVREAGHQLQSGKVDPVPSELTLITQNRDFLNRYEQFKGTYEKLKKFAENIKQTIDFVKPAARSDADEQSLKKSSLKLYEETIISEKIRSAYARDLEASYLSVFNLKDRMWTTLEGSELSWSLQRFCQIVDNKGKPLSWFGRSLNFFTTPVVPKTSAIPPLNNQKNYDLDQSFIIIPQEMPNSNPPKQPENSYTTISTTPPNSPHVADFKSNEGSKLSEDPNKQPENPKAPPNNILTISGSKNEESQPFEDLNKPELSPIINLPASSNPSDSSSKPKPDPKSAAPSPINPPASSNNPSDSKPKQPDPKPAATNVSKQQINPSAANTKPNVKPPQAMGKKNV